VISLTSSNIAWNQITSNTTDSTGYVDTTTNTSPLQLGSYTNTSLQYLTPGSLIQFTTPTPATQFFDTNKNNIFTTGNLAQAGVTSYLWAEVVSVSGDGRGLLVNSSYTGVLSSGYGAIMLNKSIPNGAIISQIIPSFTRTFSSSVITTMIDLVFANKPFGLSYSGTTQSWQIIFETNLNTTSSFSLGNQGDLTNANKDSSWILLFTTNNEYYTVTARELRYVFESDTQVTFYFDTNTKIYDIINTAIVKDNIKILSINTQPPVYTSPFTLNYNWDVVSEYNGQDGYIDPSKIIVSFADSTNSGIVDNPQLFLDIVSPNNTSTYIVQEKYLISQGEEDYRYVYNNPNNPIVTILPTKSGSGIDKNYYYFIDTNYVAQYMNGQGFVPTLDYKVYVGRDKLKFPDRSHWR
jgi:hypothetical protein